MRPSLQINLLGACIIILLMSGCGAIPTTSTLARTTNATRSTPNPPSSTPFNRVTPSPTTVRATPTPVPTERLALPTQTPSPTLSPAATPVSDTSRVNPSSKPTLTPTTSITLESLRGKIVFLSDRGGVYPQLYVMDADGSNARPCYCAELLEALVTNETASPDKKQFLFLKTIGGGRGPLGVGADIQIWAHHNDTNYEAVVTGAAPGFPGVDYDPVWSPDSRHIAWVSQANGNDEIYLYDASTGENERLTESHWEWYKHPTFSPDGARLAYWTNRDGRKQIWVMDLKGSNARNLSSNSYNDWDPIWVK